MVAVCVGDSRWAAGTQPMARPGLLERPAPALRSQLSLTSREAPVSLSATREERSLPADCGAATRMKEHEQCGRALI